MRQRSAAKLVHSAHGRGTLAVMDTVKVSEPPHPTDLPTLERICELEVYRADGPGGQKRNKTQNAVRLHHPPSGVTVTATERRSLSDNRRLAYRRLIDRLEKLNYVAPERHATCPTQGSNERRLAKKERDARTKKNRRRAVRED